MARNGLCEPEMFPWKTVDYLAQRVPVMIYRKQANGPVVWKAYVCTAVSFKIWSAPV